MNDTIGDQFPVDDDDVEEFTVEEVQQQIVHTRGIARFLDFLAGCADEQLLAMADDPDARWNLNFDLANAMDGLISLDLNRQGRPAELLESFGPGGVAMIERVMQATRSFADPNLTPEMVEQIKKEVAAQYKQ